MFRKIHKFILICLIQLCFNACFAERVDVSPNGFELLKIPAKSRVKAKIQKDLIYHDKKIPSGTEIEIEETWIKRHVDKFSSGKKTGLVGASKTKGYRIRNYYKVDSLSNRSFILPKDSADIYYFGHVEGQRNNKVVVPEQYLQVLSPLQD